ncbi:hypothetical protein BsWGS_07275 [Bradybaena similaris]
MDILANDQSFHGSLVRDLGLDNPGLDLPSDLQDIIFKGDGSMCISDDDVVHGAFENTAYSTRTNGNCSTGHNISVQGQGLMQGHGHLGDPQEQIHVNGLPNQLNQQLQQQLQQHYHNQHQQLHHHVNRSNSCEHEGHHHQHHQHQHQQQPPHRHQNHHQQQTPPYCSISGQPQYLYDGYDQPPQNHTSLPDSPPDSGSEPYSPPDGNLHQAMTDLKSLPVSLPTISQAMYLNHSNRLTGMPPNKAHPAYLGEPPKLNHHHQASLQQQQEQQQQQQQQQQQGQRLPVPYSASVPMGQHMPSHQISPPLSHPILPAQMGSMTNIASQVKKRKFSDSPTGTLNSSMMHGMNGVLSIKQEPPGAQFSSYIGDCSVGDDDLSPYDIDSNGAFIESTYQVIKWLPFSQTQWVVLTDGDLKDLPTPHYRVDADKGFNFSVPDEAFVCQKKNHFQVTVHMRLHGNAKYIRTVEGVKKIENYYLHFYGIKMESQNQHIKIEQSQSDRSKKSFHPVKVDLSADRETKVTVGRLHFSETTSNNMRKKGKPNPDQRYFLLVVSLHAHCADKDYMLVGSVSDRIIVRASNPGQFDSDVDVMWQKGQTQESVYHMGKVGVNTDHPEESLTVHGNIRLTGHLIQPSDIRAKQDIQEIDPKGQLENVSKLRIYKYRYKEDYAAQAGIPPENVEDVGVLAQEILGVLPDAVQVTGDVVLSNGETIENFLVVNKDRIYMENVGAVKELSILTNNLKKRLTDLEKVDKKLGKLKRFDSLKSTSSSMSGRSVSTISCSSSVAPKHCSSNSNHGVDRSTCRSSHQNGYRCSSQGKSLSSSKSTLSSFTFWPFKNKCNSWFRYLIIGLILLMVFCLAALACLYILEVQKPDSESPVVSAAGSDSGILSAVETTAYSVTNEESTPTISRGSMSTEIVTRSSTAAATMRTSTTATTSTATALFSSGQPFYPPVVPPYPPCTEGYCEKLCCPGPHEDGYDVDLPSDEDPPYHHVDNNNSGPNGEGGEYQRSGEEGQTVTKDFLPARTNSVDTMIVNLPDNTSNRRKPDYNVNSVENSPVRYSVIDHNNRQKLYSVYSSRRRRGADDAPRPTVRITELNYSLSDVYCEVCQGRNYTYFVPYNASFGYDQITLEFSTPTMSYMALCSSSFMWRCPMPTEDGTEVGGLQIQQTNNARWTIKIGTHFRTIFTFRVIHSLKGKSVANACSIENNDDYVVMSYTIRFQRQC